MGSDRREVTGVVDLSTALVIRSWARFNEIGGFSPEQGEFKLVPAFLQRQRWPISQQFLLINFIHAQAFLLYDLLYASSSSN